MTSVLGGSVGTSREGASENCVGDESTQVHGRTWTDAEDVIVRVRIASVMQLAEGERPCER